jgi:aryl-alcohol dehydrogenase-like predicted oxidoreductase
MNFGPSTPEEDAHAIMDAALDAGVNFFDTANTYGWRKGQGVTERIIGRWFAKGEGRRDKVVIATKVYGSMGDWPNEKFLSARSIRHACEGSLRRLKTDHIDLYQMHHVDPTTPFDEIWQAMEVLVQQGKVIYVGSSNFAGWNIAHAQESARNRRFMGLVSEQCLYNLLERHAEEEVLPAASHYGLGILSWSPLMRGLLGGVLSRTDERVRTASAPAQRLLDTHRDRIERFESLCAGLGSPPAAVALAWLLTRPEVTAPIVGPRTSAQLESALTSLELRLDEQTLRKLDAIFPGPGPSPESFAW